MVTTAKTSRPHGSSTPVASVTTAARSATEERDDRTRRYLMQMGLRILAFPLGTWLIWSGTSVWLGVLLLLFAAVIPYVAVVLANARKTDEVGIAPQAVTPQYEQLAAPTQEARGPRVNQHDVIVGDVVAD